MKHLSLYFCQTSETKFHIWPKKAHPFYSNLKSPIWNFQHTNLKPWLIYYNATSKL
jgi:hypothetical protein